MIATLPMFPLELVAFPTEQLALHIFEHRYQQLLTDCEENDITFGIPTYIGGTLKFGTEMRLLKVVNRNADGTSDILCKGIRVFELMDFKNNLEDKLYGGGNVQFLSNELRGSESKNRELKSSFKKFYNALGVGIPVKINSHYTSYTLAHKAGLTLEQEYELLQITTEDERVDFLIDHLKVMITTLSAVDRTKELIALNGHFKYFDPLDFKDLDVK
jgi:Lon protease-like protein